MKQIAEMTMPELIDLAARAVTLEVKDAGRYAQIAAEIELKKKAETKYLKWLSEQRT